MPAFSTGNLIMRELLSSLESLYPGINTQVFELVSLIDTLVLGNPFPGNLYRYPGINDGLFPGNLLLVLIFHTISIKDFRGKINPQLVEVLNY